MNRKIFLKKSVVAGTAILTSMPSKASNSTIENPNYKLEITNPKHPNICKTCGTRYSAEKYNHKECKICLDDRQYVKSNGQQWVSYDQLADKHAIKIKQHSEHLFELVMTPQFAIEQRAFFVQTPNGNILWDCIPFISEPIIDFIQQRGGVQMIAISHPHYYSMMKEWSQVFDCPIYIHRADKEWVMDDTEKIEFWDKSELQLNKDLKLVHIGGHFPGSAILQVRTPDLGNSILVGDTLYLSLDQKHLSVMHSYPNFVPLSKTETLRVLNTVNILSFNSLFGAFEHQNLYENAHTVLEESIKRY